MARQLTDEEIQTAIADGFFYFEVYFTYDRDTYLSSVSSVQELEKSISLAESMGGNSHVWLMVPRTWSESVAKPTSHEDLLRIRELYTPMLTSEEIP